MDTYVVFYITYHIEKPLNMFSQTKLNSCCTNCTQACLAFENYYSQILPVTFPYCSLLFAYLQVKTSSTMFQDKENAMRDAVLGSSQFHLSNSFISSCFSFSFTTGQTGERYTKVYKCALRNTSIYLDVF